MYVRQLTADFRREYHVSYLDVPTDEAVRLASMLREGSEYVRALEPQMGWNTSEALLADIVDSILRLTHMLSDARTTEGAPTVPRPGSDMRSAEAKRNAARTREYIESQEWEAVDG